MPGLILTLIGIEMTQTMDGEQMFYDTGPHAVGKIVSSLVQSIYCPTIDRAGPLSDDWEPNLWPLNKTPKGVRGRDILYIPGIGMERMPVFGLPYDQAGMQIQVGNEDYLQCIHVPPDVPFYEFEVPLDFKDDRSIPKISHVWTLSIDNRGIDLSAPLLFGGGKNRIVVKDFSKLWNQGGWIVLKFAGERQKGGCAIWIIAEDETLSSKPVVYLPRISRIYEPGESKISMTNGEMIIPTASREDVVVTGMKDAKMKTKFTTMFAGTVAAVETLCMLKVITLSLPAPLEIAGHDAARRFIEASLIRGIGLGSVDFHREMMPNRILSVFDTFLKTRSYWCSGSVDRIVPWRYGSKFQRVPCLSRGRSGYSIRRFLDLNHKRPPGVSMSTHFTKTRCFKVTQVVLLAQDDSTWKQRHDDGGDVGIDTCYQVYMPLDPEIAPSLGIKNSFKDERYPNWAPVHMPGVMSGPTCLLWVTYLGMSTQIVIEWTNSSGKSYQTMALGDALGVVENPNPGKLLPVHKLTQDFAMCNVGLRMLHLRTKREDKITLASEMHTKPEDRYQLSHGMFGSYRVQSSEPEDYGSESRNVQPFVEQSWLPINIVASPEPGYRLTLWIVP